MAGKIFFVWYFLRWLGNYYVCANSVLLGGWEVMKAITLCRTALQFQSEDERGGAFIFPVTNSGFRMSLGAKANQLSTEIHLNFRCHSYHSASRVHLKQWLHKIPTKACSNGFARYNILGGPFSIPLAQKCPYDIMA